MARSAPMPPVSRLDRLDRILGVVVDDLGTLGLGRLQAIRDGIDREDAAGAQELGAGDGELADRDRSRRRPPCRPPRSPPMSAPK